MNPDLQKELFSRLDAFAAKLGVGAAHMWGVLTKQAYIEGISDFIWMGFGLTVVGIALYIASFFMRKERKLIALDVERETKWREHKGEDNSRYAPFRDAPQDRANGTGHAIAGTLAILALAFFIFSMYQFTDGIQHVLNPEFYALQLLIDSVKQ